MATTGTAYITRKARSIKAMAAAVDAFATQILEASKGRDERMNIQHITDLWSGMKDEVEKLNHVVVNPTDDELLGLSK